MCSKSRQIRNQVAPLILFSFQFMSILVRKQVVQLLLLLHSREQVRIESMTSKLLKFHVEQVMRKFKHYTNQGQLQRWTEHSTLIFENLKPVEISNIFFNIIWISLKVIQIFKIRRVWLKNYACHAHFNI